MSPAEGNEVDKDLTEEQLDAYDTRAGWWNPDHGDLEIPDGWEFLPRGDAFLTRRVKAAGRYWLAWSPRSRSRPHRRKLGLLAPKTVIDAAEAEAAATAAKRAQQRVEGAKHRARQEDRYREQLAAAILDYLDFAPEHGELAGDIAATAATRAGEVGSGRVGRTRTLTLEDRAELAARAHIRHHHTSYHDTLADLPIESMLYGDDWLYREAKATAQLEVDDFLDRHRRR
jgi:hypothetical protein